MTVLSLVLSGLSVAGTVFAAPQLSFGNASGVRPGVCSGQSCVAADLSGSTGNLPQLAPQGGTNSGWVCVARYNPEGKAAADRAKAAGRKTNIRLFADPPAVLTVEKRSTEGVAIVERQLGRGVVERQLGRGGFSGSCKPNILIFAKGTTESGEFGSTVGPGLRTAINSRGGGQWTVVGVNYNANSDGNYCVGLPGGMVAKEVLESAAQKCPSSKIFLSGYSQGAMVVRNAVAYSNDQARSQVKGLLTYGDPFNGAQIKGWTGPINTYCRDTDAVCTGQFKIGTAHLAYSSSSDVTDGANWLIQLAKSL